MDPVSRLAKIAEQLDRVLALATLQTMQSTLAALREDDLQRGFKSYADLRAAIDRLARVVDDGLARAGLIGDLVEPQYWPPGYTVASILETIPHAVRVRASDLAVGVLEKEGRPMRLADIVHRVVEAGFASTAKTPSTVIANAVRGDDRIEKVQRGMYALRGWHTKPSSGGADEGAI